VSFVVNIPTDYEGLKYFIENTVPSENRDFEYKEILPQDATKQEKEKIRSDFRKAFCAFANARGGYVIVGIREEKLKNGRRKRRITGCSEIDEINRTVSHLVQNHIRPPIDNIQIQSIKIPKSKKYVHVIRVPASSSFKKPHMFNEFIYHRCLGESPPINGDGARVREILEVDYFSPGSVEAFEDFINSFRKYDGGPPPHYERYLLNLGKYLHRNSDNDPRFSDAYAAFKNLCDLCRKTDSLIPDTEAELSTVSDAKGESQKREVFKSALDTLAAKVLVILQEVT
jgi:hypothetical protein